MNMSEMVSLSHYDGLNGFGSVPMESVENLGKALSAGYEQTNQTGGSALRVESLEASLKVVTYNDQHIKLWKKIPKSPAYSTVEEYNELSAYGNTGSFGFTMEGELPSSTDTSYARRTQFVKFMGTTREITHPATLVHPAHGNIIALENQNGILWVLRQVERSLFTADSALAADGNAEQWDGLDAQIDATSFVDLEGNPLQEADIEEAANAITEAFGYPTDLFLGYREQSDLTKTMYPRERVALPAPVNGKIGQAVTAMQTNAGSIEFNPDLFIEQNPSPPTAATHANAPDTPQAITSGQSGTDGDFTKGTDETGDTEYAYVCTACNRFGESAHSPVMAATETLTAANRLAGLHIDLTLTNAASIGAFPTEFFRIYRTIAMTASAAVPTAATSYSLIMQVATSSQAAAGTTAVDDLNFILPFTSTAYMGQMDESVLTFRQLAPMMRLDLAVLAPSYRWMILLYGTPILFAPRKWLRMVNIGRLQ
jgi:hypothetical protein